MIASEEDSEKLLEDLENEAGTATKELQECRKRRQKIKEQLRFLTKTVKSLEIRLPKLQLEISGCDTTREELTKLVPELREQSEISDEDADKMAELQENVERCKSDMESCVELADALEMEVSQMQKQILEAGGTRLKNQKASCKKIISKLNEREKQLNSSKVEVKSSEKAAAKAKDTREALEKDLEQCQDLLSEKENEFKSLEAGAFEVMAAYEQVKKVEEQKRVALELATKEAEDLNKSQSEVRCLEIDLLGQLEAFEKHISEHQKKKNHWEKEIKRLHEIEDETDYNEDDPSDENICESKAIGDAKGEATGSDGDDAMETDDMESEDVGENETKSTTLAYSVLERYDPAEIKETISTLESERNVLAKNANMGAITEYRKKEADYLSR